MHYNVTNGEEMAAYLSVNRPDCSDPIPVNEHMEEGTPDEDLFSGMFIVERLRALHMNITTYQDKVLKYLDAFREPENVDHTYHLFFDESPRGYANLLTVLGYLDRANYRSPVELTFVSSDFSRDVRSCSVSTEGMFNRYKEFCRSHSVEAIPAYFA